MSGKIHQFIIDYLHFSRRGRLGILVLAALILLIFFLPLIIQPFSSGRPAPEDTAWIAEARKLEQSPADFEERGNNSPNYPTTYSKQQYGKRPVNLFEFDPNTITPEEWQQLGLREKTIATIRSYLAKGGRFRKPEDLSRIYGLYRDEYERIAPYIRISQTAASSAVPANSIVREPINKQYAPRISIIDINTADTAAFIALPGIGSKLATRITNFRDKLGGFYSIDQVAETFGLPDSTFQKIRPWLRLESMTVKKININTVTIDELKTHPYIKWSLANAVIAYRNEHGPFTQPNDLQKIMAVTPEIYRKIAPYISVQ